MIDQQQPPVDNSNHHEPENRYCSTSDPALLYAWHYYITYDEISNKQKNRHIQHRRQIILLGLVATSTAVLTVLPGFSNFIRFLEDTSPVMAQVLLWIRSILLVAAPIAISGLMTYTFQFAPSLTWVVHRVGAEKIRRAIYLYRLNAGSYDKPGLSVSEKQTILRKAVDGARSEIDKLDTLIPSHLSYREMEPEKLAEKIVKDPDKKTGYTDSPDDNGFAPMSGVHYETQRVVPQRDWYVDRIYKDYKQLRRSRFLILLFGGIGALAAAVGNGWEQYIVVTTAAITAITTYVQLKMYGQVYPNYHMTVGKLDSEIAWWRGLTEDQKKEPANVSRFVKRVEDIFQAERVKWLDQATQAMMAGEQALLKNVNEWTEGRFGSGESVDNYPNHELALNGSNGSSDTDSNLHPDDARARSDQRG